MKNWQAIENRLRGEGRAAIPSPDHVACIMGAVRDARADQQAGPAAVPFRYGWSLLAASALAATVICALSLRTVTPEQPAFTLGAIDPEPIFALEAATHAPLTREAAKLRIDLAGATAFLGNLLPSATPDGG